MKDTENATLVLYKIKNSNKTQFCWNQKKIIFAFNLSIHELQGTCLISPKERENKYFFHKPWRVEMHAYHKRFLIQIHLSRMMHLPWYEKLTERQDLLNCLHLPHSKFLLVHCKYRPSASAQTAHLGMEVSPSAQKSFVQEWTTLSIPISLVVV